MKRVLKRSAVFTVRSGPHKANAASVLLGIKVFIALIVFFLVSLVHPVSGSSPDDYIWIANAGEDTVSKIDINSNTEVARYATWFFSGTNQVVHPGVAVSSYCNHPVFYDKAHYGPAPSRIARDIAGNVYVLDRFFWSSHLPVLLKIAPIASGTTSSGAGLSAVLPITDGGDPNHIDPGEAQDTAILWTSEIGDGSSNYPTGDLNALGRSLALDKNGVLWVGMYYRYGYYKVSSATGSMIPPTPPTLIPTPGHSPYSCAVDVNGKLWSINAASGLDEIDTVTNQVTPHDHSTYGTNYSLAIYNDCTSSPFKVKVYLSESSLGRTYIVYDSQTSSFSNPPLPATAQFNSRSIAVDSQGYIISGENYCTGRVIKTSQTGTVVWDTTTAPLPSNLPSGQTTNTVPAEDLHGIIVDAQDNVWTVHYHENRVVKYSGATGQWLATVPVGEQPYTYGNTPPPTCNGPPAAPSCAPVADKDIHCEPNGGYSYTFDVTNNSGKDVSQILLTPVQGSSFTLSPQLFNLSSPLHDGQSTTLTVKIKNVKPGTKVCFFLNFVGKDHPCCIIKVCPTLPVCGGGKTPTPGRR